MSSKSEYLNDFWTSCDWSNDAKNSALITGINYILKYILNIKNISQYYCFCCILDQTNTGLVNRRDFFKKIIKKILLFKNFWMVVYIIYIYIYIIWWWWAAWTKKCQGRFFVPVQPCPRVKHTHTNNVLNQGSVVLYAANKYDVQYYNG